ncbi:MAG: RNA polymerase factor sigma-54 [Bacteroidales bacterium]|nr:RNA polymerase factor sigma-54 [Bacteroidales bacterium]
MAQEMLKQSLQQKLLQKLSPQQIQMIKLLEIPTIQLEQRIKKELEENPVLEEGKEEDELVNDAEEEFTEDNLDNDPDEFSLDDYINDEDIPSYKLAANNYSKDDKKEDIPFSVGTSFHEHLQNQIGLRNLSEKEEVLALYLIGNIDDDGYVRRKLEAIVNDLAFSQNIETTEEELLEVLRIIQDMEPVGVGARTLQECLLLQIENKNQEISDILLARKILKYYFQEFTKKHYEKIITRLNISEEELKNAVNEILKLNPKPGSSYSETQSHAVQTIVPDFILDNKDGELQLSLNAKNVPELRLNSTYTDMLEGYAQKSKNQKTKNDREAISFVKQKLDSAKWFIDAIRQRQNTLMLTMNAIIDYQYNYFLEGDESQLKPMILKDIAERTGLDISTISRVANSKYVQTHFGIFPLKYFFSEGLQTESGEEVSSREIKSILKNCVENEDKKKPLTDDKLTNILKEKGYRIARRTVAKYREQLNIPVARLRKEL